MNTTEQYVERLMIDEAPQIPTPFVKGEVERARKRSHGKLLFAAGLLGIVSAAFILAAPELGMMAAIGGTLLAGAGSAGMTILARR